MSHATEPAAESLAAKLIPTGPDKSRQKNALKALTICDSVIRQVAAREQISFLIHDEANFGWEVITISDVGVTRVSKRKVLQRLTFGEIAETRLLRHPRGMLVAVESFKAQNDYLPNDARRYEHVIQFMTGTPNAA